MLVLQGPPQSQTTTTSRIVGQCQQHEIQIASCTTWDLYLVQTSAELSPHQYEQLCSLLDANTLRDTGSDHQPNEATFYVVPRRGTRSPWSSKATDIAQSCLLNTITRIERCQVIHVAAAAPLANTAREFLTNLLHDPMTQDCHQSFAPENLLSTTSPRPLQRIPLLADGVAALEAANQQLGLALNAAEIGYLLESYQDLQRNPTDAELMMFAQANSEHCRHKIFNATWTIAGQDQPLSLFAMIKNTYKQHSQGVLSAYKDNAAVISSPRALRFFPDATTKTYGFHDSASAILLKVETHNHPTAISPFPGAATGSGGEIRDEGATGRGGKPKAGLVGFSVANLQIPGFEQAWENQALPAPPHLASPLQIMLEGPIGAASYNNEFGRPALCGYFRTFEQLLPMAKGTECYGYRKPIMIAGGLGQMAAEHVAKQTFAPGTQIIVLGGPSMLIGLGGGSASSQSQSQGSQQRDYASVQRDNPEMQRRCQQVIDSCWQLGSANPIAFIHDVGAGGLANAVPEIVNDAGMGGTFDLSKIPRDDPSLSPMELWCNESQERYVIAVPDAGLQRFIAICHREKCPYAVIGKATAKKDLKLTFGTEEVVNLPLKMLFGLPPKMHRNEAHFVGKISTQSSGQELPLGESINRLLKLPAIADKGFLITIGDRTVGGLSHRDQLVGPWQVPVADAAVTATDFRQFTGEALSMGERPLMAISSPAASARLAVGEAITNIAGTDIGPLGKIKLSANWQAAANHGDQGAALFAAVAAIGNDFCPALDLTIPVGKDSLSMKSTWEDSTGSHEVISPVSLIISAFAPVNDIRKTVTAAIKPVAESELWLLDLGAGNARLGGSCYQQVWQMASSDTPDITPDMLRSFYLVIQDLVAAGILLAYHDRSDGGLFVTLAEMAFAGHCGLTGDLADLAADDAACLFAEELGAVVQIADHQRRTLIEACQRHGFASQHLHCLGRPNFAEATIHLHRRERTIYREATAELHRKWSELSYQMQALRDNPQLAEAEWRSKWDYDNLGLQAQSIPDAGTTKGLETYAPKVRVAILRDQGVNGQVEMAAAFAVAGAETVDVTMTDIEAGDCDLAEFQGLAVCGGFSYGDVLGAGQGWAKSILYNPTLRAAFAKFFARPDTFSLGVCNGCQMLSQLREIIPGTAHWPRFIRNRSNQFEARLSLVRINPSPSVFLSNMAGSHLAVAVAHGEGQAVFDQAQGQATLTGIATMQFVGPDGQPTESYPANPNGSPQGVTSLTSQDGRVLIMMPHPERVFRTCQLSWSPPANQHQEFSAWWQMFRNAVEWAEGNQQNLAD